MKKLFFLFLLGLLFFASCKDNDEPERVPNNLDKKLILQIVNSYRTNGCDCGTQGNFPPTTPVVWNDLLEFAAWDHSRDMNNNNFFAHTGSNGSSPSDRIKKRGYNWIAAGENIASGTSLTENSVVALWINSPGHCANIMNPKFKEMGVAKVGKYWTQNFGAR